MSRYNLTDDFQRKRFMFLIMTICGMTVLISLSILALLHKDLPLFITDMLFAGILLSLLLRIRGIEKIEVLITATLFMLTLFLLYLFLSWKAQGQTYFWFYVIPIFTLFLMGSRKGILISLVFIVLSITSYAVLSAKGRIPAYPPGVVLRLSLSYILVTFLTYVFERTRYESQVMLDEAMEELRDKATRDGLTGLYNRRYMDEIWALLIRDFHESRKMITFIMADLDFFKSYNDTYGHQMGDDVLKQFGSLLLNLNKRKTDYVFRYGGEEFCLLLFGADEKTSLRFCEEIREGILDLNIPHKKSPFQRVTISLGAVMCPLELNLKPAEVIKDADDALYRAKEEGRNNTVFVKT